jgi:hypothetical protein
MFVVENAEGGWWTCANSGKQNYRGLIFDTVQFLKPGNPHGKTKNVAFGVDDSNIIISEDKHIERDLKGSYDTLDKELERCYDGDVI